MITIRYKSVIINGLDRTNKVETLHDDEALRLVKMGYAEIVRENATIKPPEIRLTENAVKSNNTDIAPREKRVRK
ncbi:MAG: hypothetical protein PHQ43_13990 [Dehalococcoidales bacterium]|nr:hypothetical protein [Dehalococcoidales bacterium]